MNIILSLLAVAFGIILIMKTEWFVQNFGSSAWAEEHMGTSGGTRMLYKLIGLAIIVIAILAMTGLLGTILIGVFGKLFGGF